MNIRNRIIKLEAKTNVGNGFCACSNINKFEVYRSDLSESSTDTMPRLMDESRAVPDFCLQCRKPIEKDQIILQFCDHTTKDRFPKEWDSHLD